MSATLEISKREKLAESVRGVNNLNLPAAKEAQLHLSALELPHFKTEDWKYTHVAHLSKTDWQVAPSTDAVDVKAWTPEGHNGPTLVFVNGFYRDDLSTGLHTPKVFVGSLEEGITHHRDAVEGAFGKLANTKDHVFTAMNTAHTTGGAFINVANGAVAEQPVHILHVMQGNNVVAQPHHIFNVGKNGQLKVTMSFVSDANVTSFNNVVLEAALDADALVHIDQLQYEGEQANTIFSEYIAQERNSQFNITTITLNGALVRNGLNIDIDGEHCETNLSGLYITKDRQLVDNHTVVDHKVPNCESNELYKGLLDDMSTGVFNGKVYVRQDAQKTNAFQSNGNILLSDHATINSKPELEIYADDVKCSHGSTTGQLDEEAVFYLRARGLSHDSARKMMVGAFAADVLEKMDSEGLRAQVDEILETRFGWKK